MQNTIYKLKYLLTHPDWSAEDQAWMEAYIQDKDHTDLESVLKELFEQDLANAPETVKERVSVQMWENLKEKIEKEKSVETPVVALRKARVNSWWSAAAVIAVVLSVCTITYFLVNRFDKVENNIVLGSPALKEDTIVKPGTNGAILTLSDGSKIVLDSVHRARSLPGSQLVLQQDVLSYTGVPDRATAIANNNLSTPKGRQFKVVLADGTQVWLNAGSSLTYPTHFEGKERRVQLNGEAYFEVAKNKEKPFFVQFKSASGNGEIKVLGTHFNVKAYNEEPLVQTTLLEGSVAIAYKDATQKIRPGQQAVIGEKIDRIQVKEVSTENEVAWKEGLFEFNNTPLAEVMRQLSRWYNIEVQYEGGIPIQNFDGSISKKSELKRVLEMLEQGGIQYKMKGRTLIVQRTK